MSRARRSRAPFFAALSSGAVFVLCTALLAVVANWIALAGARRSRGYGAAKAPRTAGRFGAGAQRAASGVGPLIHRRYRVDIPRASTTAHVTSTSLMRAIKSCIARLSPSALAQFRKTNGESGEMRVGDEYDITMLGPWNGRVRVVAVGRESFTLITLKGHPESGHITFRVRERRIPGRPFRVSIESWARSRNATVDLMYSKIGLGKHVQAKVWVTFLRRSCELAGLKVPPRIHVLSEEVNA